MVTIKPFRGIRYASAKVSDLSLVISQPHDKIPPPLQEQYYNLSPYNIVRVIKGKSYPTDTPTDNVYTRAAATYQTWLREGVLVHEQAPALYVTHQTFSLPNGQLKTRQGLTAALKVSDYDEGIVRPHERILPKSMADRYNLTQTTHANFGSVFMLYPGSGINELLQPALEQQPPLEFHDLHEGEVLQQFWMITDSGLIAAVLEAMAAKPYLIIADGHHRYETAIKYRDEMRLKYPSTPANAGFNYVQVTLVSMDDPGLVILPTHRVIHLDQKMSRADLLTRAAEYFDITPLPDRPALETALTAAQNNTRPTFGLYDGAFALLSLRSPDTMARLLPAYSAAWRTLDVTVLHELFIERVLGIDKEAVALKEKVEFIRDVTIGYNAIAQGQADYLLVLNPTRIEQVQACTAASERMPQKATDFYPKLLNGLVMTSVSAEERL